MRIILSSVFVDDQAKALALYTEVLGFVKKQDSPVESFRWLTVVSPQDPGEAARSRSPSSRTPAGT